MEAGHAQPSSTFRDDAALWPTQPVQLARGRQPRDALAKTIPYNVSSMDEFETSLREYLSSPSEQPEHTEARLSFWIGTSFMVSAPPSTSNLNWNPNHNPPQPQHISAAVQHISAAVPPPPPTQSHLIQPHPHAPPGYQPANGLQAHYGRPSHAYQTAPDLTNTMTLPNASQSADSNDSSQNGAKKAEHKVSLSIMEALQPAADPKDKMRKQRAIAKCCVESIQQIDGYRYSFHNCWNSREDDSFRFSYYCNDSLLNKDRAANGKGAKLGKRATKPVYDCKGVLSIKFSATKNTLDVFYKHVPIHKTYEERAPPPRKDSKRRKVLEETDPEALARMASRSRQPTVDSEDVDGGARLKKKKTMTTKPELPRHSNTSLESDLRAQSLRSLLELIYVDPAPEPTPPDPPPHPRPLHPPPQPPQQQQPQTIERPALQIQTQPAQQRRRPRNSCDLCKAKKTKCDGSRPVCQTCIDKKRQCFYSDPGPNAEDHRPAVDVNGTVPQAPALNNELSELEKMKKELEEARARIQELESEKGASTTPVETPQIASRPQSQPQAQHRPQPSHTQIQQHTPQQQRQQSTSQHRLQLSQLNQGHRHGLSSPQQTTSKMDIQSPQQRLQTRQRQLSSPQQSMFKMDTQSPQQQLQTRQRQLSNPQQQLHSAQQQLQAAAAQQMQVSQHSQLQTQTYFTANHTIHSPYNRMNRSMTQNSLPVQNPMLTQNPMSTTQTQPAVNHMHGSGTGLAPTASSVDANTAYNRSDFAWPPAAYYGYQNAQQQQQQDQWAATRGSGVFR